MKAFEKDERLSQLNVKSKCVELTNKRWWGQSDQTEPFDGGEGPKASTTDHLD